MDGSGSGEDAGGAERFRGADEGAEIAGILESGGDQDEGNAPEDSIELCDRRDEQSGYALWRAGFGDAVEDLFGEVEDLDAISEASGRGWQGTALREKDGFEDQAAADSFFEQVFALDADQSGAEAGVACQGSAKLLDACVGAAGDELGAVWHLCRILRRRSCADGSADGVCLEREMPVC